MKPFEELVNNENSAFEILKEWLAGADTQNQLLPASEENRRTLYKVQASTSSLLGALAYETGGILIDHGWLRILGSGSKGIPRTLVDLNHNDYGYLIFADDAAGGFYAVNQGSLGKDIGNVYFLAPDYNEWDPLEIDLEVFVQLVLSEDIDEFYEGLRWSTWKTDIQNLKANECFGFYPFLWTEQGDIEESQRKPMQVKEAFNLKIAPFAG
ncbi:MAG: DUF2625 domain-containing protein [Lentisphaerales bacterium]|nr:DUF2625 domain-containing protein [Lentisphaerales bacterium]